ncbi:MAG: type II secretion system protein [Candidatus Omnitrophota bacterium]
MGADVMMPKRSRRGFTLFELLVALAASGVFFITVISTLYYSARVGKVENLKGQLRIGLDKALERMKLDAHLSNSNGIVFYPTSAATFTAISLPQATPGGSGLLTLSSGAISWNRTVIYHLFVVGTQTELRRTVFNSYQATAASRQTQLNNVVLNGDGRAGPGGNYSTTTVFAADTASLTINPQYATFDGYAATTTKSAATSFGSLVLTPGTHDISFIVTGKNGLSGGYKIGMDQVVLSPSGGEREAEALPVAAASNAVSTENMSAFAGQWGGSQQIECQSSAINDYVTLEAYYDMWLESNFDKVTHSNTTVYGLNTAVSGPNPALTLASREDQCKLWPAWQAQTQAMDTSGGFDSISGADQTIRCVVVASQIQRNGNLMRVKFTAGVTGGLNIKKAYFGVRSPGSGDFTADPTVLYLDNDPIEEGHEDPPGSTNFPGSRIELTIPAGFHAWTNWFACPFAYPAASDYLISFFVTGGSAAMAWTDDAGATQSYIVADDHARDLALVLPTPGSQIIGSEQIATWINVGTATSQIYDTKLPTPALHQIAWVSSLPGGSFVVLRARTSHNADMSGASAWSADMVNSPGSLTGTRRYVQWQATLQAGSLSATYPQIDNVKIDWPGQSQLVEVSGVFTKRPNYGIFKVQVDDTDPVKALEFQLVASKVLQGKSYTMALKSEESPANTGK